jgi:hypothetical protein
MRRDVEEEINQADNSRASVGTTKSSRCSSVSTSLSEHSEVTGESLQEAKKRALKELETRFLRCKQRAKVTHERKKALATNENRMRETVLRHDAFVRERQNQYGRAEKAEQSERESAISLSKTIETCLHILRKTKDRTRFCERRTNRFAIAKVFLEKVLAEHGENKRGKEEEEEEEEDEEEAGRRETAAPPRDQSSSSLSSHHHHHHHDSVNFEDISDIIVRCNSLRAIHDTLTTRRSQARENVMLKASEHESTLATFRARRLDAERESVRQLLSELENARALSALEREKSKKKRDERVRASKIKSTIAKLYENVCEKSAVSRSIDAANERINNDKIENTNKHNREDVVALQLRQLSHFARDCKRILLLAN